jgi:hypothetical protein
LFAVLSLWSDDHLIAIVFGVLFLHCPWLVIHLAIEGFALYVAFLARKALPLVIYDDGNLLASLLFLMMTLLCRSLLLY